MGLQREFFASLPPPHTHPATIQPGEMTEFDSANGNHTQDHGNHHQEAGEKKTCQSVNRIVNFNRLLGGNQ